LSTTETNDAHIKRHIEARSIHRKEQFLRQIYDRQRNSSNCYIILHQMHNVQNFIPVAA
jgi:hypothetical protein